MSTKSNRVTSKTLRNRRRRARRRAAMRSLLNNNNNRRQGRRARNNRGNGSFGSTVFAGTAIGGVRKQQTPVMRNEGVNTIRIDHTEYIRDIKCTTDFNNISYAINPGNADLFKWLGIVSINFEIYKFLKLEFLYRPKCSTNEPGTVITYVDYDANDPEVGSKQEAMTGSFTDSNAWAPHDHLCTAENLNRALKMKYVRPAPTFRAVEDSNIYDSGTVQFITQNGSNDLAGELHVRYSILLSIPQALEHIELAYAFSMLGHYEGATYGVSMTNLWGTDPYAQTAESYTSSIIQFMRPTNGGRNIDIIIPGVYFFHMTNTTGSALTGWTIGVAGGCTEIAGSSKFVAGTTVAMWYGFFISTLGEVGFDTFSFTPVGTPPTVSKTDIIAFPMNQPEMIIALIGPNEYAAVLENLRNVAPGLFKKLASKALRQDLRSKYIQTRHKEIEWDDNKDEGSDDSGSDEWGVVSSPANRVLTSTPKKERWK